MKPVCVKCQRFFRMKKSGDDFIEAMPLGNGIPAGNLRPECWTPYKLWVGDQWECPDCHAQILSGFGQAPISEHYQPRFKELVRELSADQLQVNDC